MDPGADLILRRDGSVLHLELNRPGKMNALNVSLVEALTKAVLDAYRDGTRVVVLRGTGKNFSAGFDLSDIETASDGDLLLRFVRIEQLLQAVHHAPYETVVLAHGRNFGAGVDLVCACAHRIADPATSFRMPGLRFGVVLGTRRFFRCVGSVRARAILEGALTVPAEDAVEMGFCERIAIRDEWQRVVNEIAEAQSGISYEAAAALYRCTVEDSRDADLAELVRSASDPGFKERIQQYRAAVRVA